MRVRRLAKALAAVSFLAAMIGCGESGPVKIGFIAGLTGRGADLGASGFNGATLAVEEQNRKGGIDGRPLELLAKDDRQDVAAARQGLEELVKSGVKVVIGPMTSSVAMELVPLANREKVLLLSPTVTARALTGVDDYFLRVISDTRGYAETSARFHVQELGWKTVFALYDDGNRAYTASWLGDYTAKLEAMGGRVVGSTAFGGTLGVNLKDLAEQAVASGADGILILANSADAALLCQHIRVVNPKQAIGTSEWAATERFINLAGSSSEGVVVAQFVDRDSTAAAYLEFRKAYVERFKGEPGFAGVTGYDAAKVVIEALARRNRGEEIKSAILRIGQFNGIQGDVVFDSSGDSQRKTVLSRVTGGAFVTIK